MRTCSNKVGACTRSTCVSLHYFLSHSRARAIAFQTRYSSLPGAIVTETTGWGSNSYSNPEVTRALCREKLLIQCAYPVAFDTCQSGRF